MLILIISKYQHDLATLMFVSVVSESAQRISLMAQSEATDKLIKQAEQHRELLEKNFTDSLLV
jgi:hypothetical protein